MKKEKTSKTEKQRTVWLMKGHVLPSYHFEDFWKAASFDMKHQLDIPVDLTTSNSLCQVAIGIFAGFVSS